MNRSTNLALSTKYSQIIEGKASESQKLKKLEKEHLELQGEHLKLQKSLIQLQKQVLRLQQQISNSKKVK